LGSHLGISDSFLFSPKRPANLCDSFPGIKRPECEVENPHPFTAEAKNEWSHTFASLRAFMTRTGKSSSFTVSFHVRSEIDFYHSDWGLTKQQ
jgi:hypothetical protein